MSVFQINYSRMGKEQPLSEAIEAAKTLLAAKVEAYQAAEARRQISVKEHNTAANELEEHREVLRTFDAKINSASPAEAEALSFQRRKSRGKIEDLELAQSIAKADMTQAYNAVYETRRQMRDAQVSLWRTVADIETEKLQQILPQLVNVVGALSAAFTLTQGGIEPSYALGNAIMDNYRTAFSLPALTQIRLELIEKYGLNGEDLA